jgi:hypothetical protein
MKNLLKMVSIIGFTVIAQTAYSAAVTDTFETGDTLTAAQLNNIKSAVNDNDTRISDIVLTPGPAGADSTVAGPAGPVGADSTVAGPAGPAGADSTVAGPAGPAGADSTVAGPAGPAGADSTVAGPAGPAGLGAVVFSSAPTVNDDMNNSYSVGTVWVDTSTNRLYILEDSTANAAVWTIAAAPSIKYTLGDIGPAGGFVFYVTGDGLHGLEAAPEDIDISSPWGCAGVELTGMNETGIGSGAYNTSQRDLCSDAGTAAKAAAAYEFNGYTDWFLPSKGEMNLMWENLADTDNNDTNSGVGDAGNPGGFANSSYWSSSQSGTTAWYQFFFNGSQGDGFTRTNNLRVRAVRDF